MLMHIDEQLLLFSLSVHIDIIHLLHRCINACVGWHRKGSYSKIGADVNNNNKTNRKCQHLLPLIFTYHIFLLGPISNKYKLYLSI